MLLAFLHWLTSTIVSVVKALLFPLATTSPSLSERPPTPSPPREGEAQDPESVNFHFTRQCNYSCGFCFHTAKTSSLLPMEVRPSPLTRATRRPRGGSPSSPRPA